MLREHPIAALLPMMRDDEYTALVADLRQHGQREPITLIGDLILDGRNRYKACSELGIIPLTRPYDGPADAETLVRYVLSLNQHRRHLSSSQLAVIALDVERMLAVEAKERQRQAGEKAGAQRANAPRNEDGTFTKVPQLVGEPWTDDEVPMPKARENETGRQAAASVGTNHQYVSDAKRLEVEAPDLLAQVKAGELSIPKAKQEHKKRKAVEAATEAVETNKALPHEARQYRVIYADPPWKYGNTMPEYFDEQAHHYPLMTVAEIAAMPVRDLAMDNAVLFLWVTSPILFDAADVIRAWGFTYKAAFIWDKIKHNMGHYNSVRHELLLICTRGSCQPDVQTLFDSVQSIERTRHSAKPAEFRTIIDTIYPHGPRLELFARTTAEGWDAHGNQVS